MSPLNDHYNISLPNNNCCIITSNITSRANSDSSRLNVNAQPFLPATLNNVTEDGDVYSVLSNLRIKNINRILIAHLNINSLRYKFDKLSDIITGKIDIILISEAKLDNTFPLSNFKIPGFCTPFRRDGTRYGGGILLYIREDIPSTLLSSLPFSENVECFFVEIKLRQIKWLLGILYNPSKYLSKSLDHYTQSYDKILILGDFDSEMHEDSMVEFCGIYNLKNLVKDPTCYKNHDNPSCINLMLTNKKFCKHSGG